MSTRRDNELTVCPNYEILCEETTKRILALSKEAIKSHGKFSMALSGSSTPKGVLIRMASPDYRTQFSWHKIHFFWGDERWVPPDHIRSNYRMAAEALLTRVDIPYENIHHVNTKEGDPASSATLYERELISHFGLKEGNLPQFDLVLLGVGQDGHVASHFPGNVSVAETRRLVVSSFVEELDEMRVTITLPVINHARHIIFIVSGIEKAKIMHEVFEGQPREIPLPVQLIRPDRGTLSWFVDKSAGSSLKKTMGVDA